MGESDVSQSINTSDKNGDEDNDAGDSTESLSTKNDEEEYIDPRIVEKEKVEQALKARKLADAKKGLSITRSLITFGFESWLAFEPGKFKEYSIFYKFETVH